jgi:hypothetical protein
VHPSAARSEREALLVDDECYIASASSLTTSTMRAFPFRGVLVCSVLKIGGSMRARLIFSIRASLLQADFSATGLPCSICELCVISIPNPYKF